MKSAFSVTAILLVTAFVGACDKPSSPAVVSVPASSSVAPSAVPSAKAELQIVNWGPQSAKLGTVPNKQPNGMMGIWISVVKPPNFGEAQVIFGDQLATATSVQESAINAAISSDQLKQIGSKEVVIRQLSSGKSFVVGAFKIEP